MGIPDTTLVYDSSPTWQAPRAIIAQAMTAFHLLLIAIGGLASIAITIAMVVYVSGIGWTIVRAILLFYRKVPL